MFKDNIVIFTEQFLMSHVPGVPDGLGSLKLLLMM